MFTFLRGLFSDFFFKPAKPRYQFTPTYRLNPKNFDNIKMRKITRPGVDINKITLIEERIDKDPPQRAEASPPFTNIKQLLKEKRRKQHSDENKRLEVVAGSSDDLFPQKEGTIFRFYLDSNNGRYTNNGRVVYFSSKNAAKRIRKSLNKSIGREVYRVSQLTDEQLSRNLALPI